MRDFTIQTSDSFWTGAGYLLGTIKVTGSSIFTESGGTEHIGILANRTMIFGFSAITGELGNTIKTQSPISAGIGGTFIDLYLTS